MLEDQETIVIYNNVERKMFKKCICNNEIIVKDHKDKTV